MPRSVKATTTKNVFERCGTLVHIEGNDIAIFKRDAKYFAISNVCAHQHFSLLYKGRLDGLTVECPMHGWIYELETGKALTGNGKVATYPLRIEGDDILIELPDDTEA